MTNIKGAQRFREIDALRGIAALMVLFFHLTYGNEQAVDFRSGNTGVDLFFIISGFVIFLSLSKHSSVREFIRSRFIRLFPTYWFCVTFTYILIVLYFQVVDIRDFNVFPFRDYLVNLTMLQHFFGIANVDQPYWTMAVELLFYTFMALLAFGGWLRYLNLLGLLLSAGMLVFCKLTGENLRLKIQDILPLLNYLPLFMSGILFYKLTTGNRKDAATHLQILIFLGIQVSLFPFTGRSIFLTQFNYASMIFLFYICFMLVLFGKLSFIVNPVTLFLGEISYAFYLVHQFIALNLLLPFFYNYLGLNFWLTVFLIVIPLLVLVAAFITRKVQYPIANWIRTKWQAKIPR